MIRFAIGCLVLLSPHSLVADSAMPGAFHRQAGVEAEQDGAGLLDESDDLRSGERHFLPPLSEYELSRLFDDDEANPGVPKIGIVRSLPASIQLSRAELARRTNRTGSSSTVAGGRLHELEDGRSVWTTAVTSPGSDSVRLRFDTLVLPEGARLYVYGNGGESYGPYTRAFVDRVTQGAHPFWSHTVQGSMAYVEVQLADSSASLELSVDGVGHFESTLPENFTPQPEGTECFVDVSCATDDAELVTALTTATAQLRYAKGGSFYVCSGALVNVSETPEFEPYLLTANHCFDTQASASSLEAWWDYRTSTCGGETPTKGELPKTIGSTLLSSDPASDFTFVELSSKPVGSALANGSRFYLGWTPVRPAAESVLYRASHPSGGKQMWSRTIVIDARNQTCSVIPESRFIYSAGSLGGTSGGSSGASATNAQGQIVGQNYGKCGTDLSDPCNYSVANAVDGAFETTYTYISQWLRPPSTEPCVKSDSTICLQSNRFEVTLAATDPRTGKADSGYVMSSTSFFGYYAFPVLAGNQTDPQVFVKVLDGRPINGRWWVFFASLTDVEFTLTIRDTTNGAIRTYRQEAYTQQSKNDTSAFTD